MYVFVCFNYCLSRISPSPHKIVKSTNETRAVSCSLVFVQLVPERISANTCLNVYPWGPSTSPPTTPALTVRVRWEGAAAPWSSLLPPPATLHPPSVSGKVLFLFYLQPRSSWTDGILKVNNQRTQRQLQVLALGKWSGWNGLGGLLKSWSKRKLRRDVVHLFLRIKR